MISKIRFKNFKIFRQWQTLELRPITILIGKNNSGKSAILKLITLIEGALNPVHDLPINRINNDITAGNKYQDLIYGRFSRELEIEMWEIISNTSEIAEESQLSVKIAVDNTSDTPSLEYWNFDDKIILQKEEGSYLNELEGTLSSPIFKGIKLTGTDTPHNLNIDYIGSIREKTKLDYRLSSEKEFPSSGVDGKYLYDFLIRDYLTTDKKHFTKIAKWIEEKFENWQLHIDADSEPYHIELRKGSLHIDITETGIGIGQSLPLIIRSYKPCDKETLIIIEEPECHLHPYAHAQIAQLFADSIKEDSNKKYIIETHSQNFVLRLRRLIAQGDLSINDVGIYYTEFDKNRNESNLKEIKIDSNGGVKDWPEGVFGESILEARAIMNANLKSSQDVD